jgi:hypothetical protein
MNMTVRPQKGTMKPDRFEVTVVCGSKSIKHVVSAYERDEAVDRMLRVYAKDEPQIARVTRPGALPKPRAKTLNKGAE